MKKQEFMAISLPSGLKMKAPYGFRPNGKESTGVSGVIYLTHNLYADIEEKVFGDIKFIPIARPLSDLTKSITHNGETFVPIVELAKIANVSLKTADGIFEVDNEHFEFGCRLWDNFFWYDKKGCFCWIIATQKMEHKQFVSNQLDLFQKLIEWHFNLMEESEKFIPVTETFNPYK